MIVIPFVIGLIGFIYLRPQELYEPIGMVPWLDIFCLLSLFGLIVGLRLRLVRADPVPSLPLVALLVPWTVATMALNSNVRLVDQLQLMMTSIVLFAVVAQGVQSFRDLRAIAGAVVVCCALLAAVGIHQGLSPTGCIRLDDANFNMIRTGVFDGRTCETALDCRGGPEHVPGTAYSCEHTGAFGTTSIDGRVRYIGVLQDPNELAMAISAGLPLMLALATRRRSPAWALAALTFLAGILVCVILTRSRSGQLAFAVVLGTYLIYRLRGRGLLLLLALALPMLLFGGRGDFRADESTELRYEAWRAAFYYLRESPVFGIGQGMFVDRFWITAHSSYLLAASELGLVGFFLWSSIIYVSIKTFVVALVRFRHDRDPTAEIARTWALALLAAMLGMLASMVFLSLSYHFIVWVNLGLCGAYYSAIKRHRPDFQIGFGLRDALLVAVIDVVILAGTYLLLRYQGFH
jgi:hypothetical protein